MKSCLVFLLTGICMGGFFAGGCRAGEAAPRVCLGPVCYAVEIADTAGARAQGLMFRPGLPEGRGMLFIFEENGVYPFWMKNVSFPIDILWLDDQKTVVYVGEDVPPCREAPCPVYSPGVPARYVLEVPAGDAKRYGLRSGLTAEF